MPFGKSYEKIYIFAEVINQQKSHKMVPLTQSETEQIASAIFSAIENIGEYPSESFTHIIDNSEIYAEVRAFVQIQRFKGDNITPPGYSQHLRWISVNELYYGEERVQNKGVEAIMNGWITSN
jgi:hypothetical protein